MFKNFVEHKQKLQLTSCSTAAAGVVWIMTNNSATVAAAYSFIVQVYDVEFSTIVLWILRNFRRTHVSFVAVNLRRVQLFIIYFSPADTLNATKIKRWLTQVLKAEVATQ